jgi:hypothetical protein
MSSSRCPRNAIFAYTTFVRHLVPTVDREDRFYKEGSVPGIRVFSPLFCCELLFNLHLTEGLLPIFCLFLLAWHFELFRAFPLDFLHAAPQKAHFVDKRPQDAEVRRLRADDI